jgi:hypothetical protein
MNNIQQWYGLLNLELLLGLLCRYGPPIALDGH